MEIQNDKDYVSSLDFINCEKFIDEKYKTNSNFYGYLVDYNSFVDFLNKIGYQQFLKDNILISFMHKTCFKLKQAKFNSVQDLFQVLNNQKKFRLINCALYQKICPPGKINEPGMICHTQNNDTLIIDFGNNQNIAFYRNNNIIEKSSIKFSNSNNVLENEINNEPMKNQKKYFMKLQIEVLIHYYISQLKLKKVLEESFLSIKQFKCFLINRDFFFRKFYLYKDVFNYLQNEEIKNKINQFINGNKDGFQSLINDIYSFINNNLRIKEVVNVDIENVKAIQLKDFQNSNYSFKHPYNFEVINHETLLLIERFNVKPQTFRANFIINNNKIIFSTNFFYTKNDKKICFLLIGKFEKSIIEEEYLIFFNDIANLQNSYFYLQKNTYNNFISNYLPSLQNSILFPQKTHENIPKIVNIKKNVKNNEINIYQTNKILSSLILFFITSEKIKKKIKFPIKSNNNNEQYYLLNVNWFNKYLELNNMSTIFNFFLNNKNSYLPIINNDNISEATKITQIISKIDKNLLTKLNVIKEDFSQLKNPELYKIKQKIIKGVNKNNLFFYHSCLLINKTLYDQFKNEFSIDFCTNDISSVLFGDGKIIIIVKNKGTNNYIVEICNFNIQNILSVELLLEIFVSEINNLINVIKNNGLQYFYKN